MDRTSVFVDLDTLNVMFRVNSQFVAALSYRDSLSRLYSTLTSLPAGYDVYLCIKPLPPTVNAFELPQLSSKGAKFLANIEELSHAIVYFSSLKGINELYLCNWLSNYIEASNVFSFKSVAFYGKKIMDISVKEGILDSFRLFNSQVEFEQVVGNETNSYYGDIGLLDTNGFVARYPEMAGITQSRLTALLPLAKCCETETKMNARDVVLGEKFVAKAKEPTVEEDVKVHEEEPTVEKDVTTIEEGYHFEKRKPKKSKEKKQSAPVSIAAKLCATVAVISATIFGASYGMSQTYSDTGKFTTAIQSMNERIAHMKVAHSVFLNAYERNTDLSTVMSSIADFDGKIVIQGLEYQVGYITVLYAEAGDVESTFEEYLCQKYSDCAVSDAGVCTIDDVEMKQYRASFSAV